MMHYTNSDERVPLFDLKEVPETYVGYKFIGETKKIENTFQKTKGIQYFSNGDVYSGQFE
jgi:hypothetical protein